MTNVIVILILAMVLGLAIRHIVKAKKSGAKCIGCSAGSCCSSKDSSGGCTCGCGSGADAE